MRRTARTRLAPALVALLLAAGCAASGGDDEAGPATDGQTPTTEGATPTTDDATPTTDDAPTTEAEVPTTEAAPEPGTGDDEVCEPLQVVSDYDEESSTLIAEEAPWPELQDFFVASSEDVVAAYDDAIALADDELAEELTVLRDFTEEFADVAASSGSLEELSSAATEMDGVLDAGRAGMALDAFAEETCGFSTSAG